MNNRNIIFVLLLALVFWMLFSSKKEMLDNIDTTENCRTYVGKTVDCSDNGAVNDTITGLEMIDNKGNYSYQCCANDAFQIRYDPRLFGKSSTGLNIDCHKYNAAISDIAEISGTRFQCRPASTPLTCETKRTPCNPDANKRLDDSLINQPMKCNLGEAISSINIIENACGPYRSVFEYKCCKPQ